ncbi:MAG: cytochrome c [Rhodospirillales bacterium]|nr:cytochrome c [Rhodospirillales bacterium]
MTTVSRLALAMIGLVGVLGVATYSAEAQMNMMKQIEHRQEVMKGNGGAMKVLTPIVRGEAPWNQAAAVQAATTLANTAKEINALFPQGTGPEAGKTDALPAIWQNWADFQAKGQVFNEATTKLLQLAQANDEAGFKAQFPNVGKSCGGCHEGYRVKKQ